MEMGVSMEMVARSCHTDQPVDGFQSLMRPGVIIMDTKWRRVCDENVEGAPVVDAVQEQVRQEAKGSQVGIGLCILVCSIGAVADASAEAADQKSFKAHQFQVQV